MSVVMISSAWCTAEPKPNGCVLCMREGLVRSSYSSQNRDSKCFRIHLFSFFHDPRAPSSLSQK